MNQDILLLTKDIKRKSPANPELVKLVQSTLKIILPLDYVEWMLLSNGGSGNIGVNGYLLLWPLEKIIPLNEIHQVQRFAPGLILFGSDGGGEGYAFDTREAAISFVQVPLVGLSLDAIKNYGNSLLEFLQSIKN